MTKGPCPSGVSQSNGWLHRLKEPVTEPTPTKMVMEQEKPLSPQKAHPLLRWADAEPRNPPTTAPRGPGPGVKRLGVRWDLDRSPWASTSSSVKWGGKCHVTPRQGVAVSRPHGGRGEGSGYDKGQATSGAGPSFSLGEGGVGEWRDSTEAPVPCCPPPYKLQVRNLRNLVVQAFPSTSRALTHLKLGLFWAFAGGHFWEEMPTLAFLSTEQINLPVPR